MSSMSEKSTYDHEDVKSSEPKMKMKEQDSSEEHHDYEMHSKKDAPPRFSTIFDIKPQPVLAEPIVESPRRRRRHGVLIPMPIFVLLVIMFSLESIVLFAYTAIGLYNQLPGRLIPMSHSSTGVACDLSAPAAQQAPINIAPNFVVGGAGTQATLTETVTFMGRLPMTEQLSSSSSTLSSSSSSSLSSSSSTTSVPVVTVTPGGGVATSVVFVTASADTQTTLQRPTSFVTVQAGAAAASTPSSSSSVSVSASVAAKDHSAESISSSTSTSTTSTIASTSSTPIPTTSSTISTTSTAAESKGTHNACIGGAGAVALDCL